MKGRSKKLIFLFCWFFCLNGYSQTPAGESIFVAPAFTFDHWTAENGLPVNSVNDIIQTKDGYLWFATFDGLVRFDGVRFKVYQSAEYDGLPNNRVHDIIEASDGSIWLILAQNILAKFSNNSFTRITSNNGLNGEYGYELYKKDDALWIGSDHGISVYKDGRLTPYQPEVITEHVPQIFIDAQNMLWYQDARSLSLYRFDGQKKTYITSSKGPTEPTSFLSLSDGSVIFSTSGKIYKYTHGKTIEIVTDLPDDFLVVSFYEQKSSSKAVSDSIYIISLTHGMYKLSEGNLVNINPDLTGTKRNSFLKWHDNLWALGLSNIFYNNKLAFSFNNIIKNAIIDREGSLWFGSESLGLFRLKSNLFTIYSEEEGVPNRNIYPVYQTGDGTIWFGTHGDGAVRLKNREIDHYLIKSIAAGNQFVRSILQLHNGVLLISLYGEGIYTFNTAKNNFEAWLEPKPDPARVTLFSVESLYEDSKRRLWAGSTHGLYVREHIRWRRIPATFSNPDQTVRYITEAPDSSLWMATLGGGILHYKSGAFTQYTTEDGLSSNLVRSLYVDTVSMDPGYLLWIGTENKGLNRLKISRKGPEFNHIVVYDKQNGLFDNIIHQILVDDYERFWMSGNTGIFWVSRTQLSAYANKKINRINSTAYTEQDGLRNREANGGIQPAGIKSSDGNMWFPTQDGLVMVDPQNITRNEVPPPVLIEDIKSGDQEVRLSKKEGARLTPRQRNFEIAYTGLSFMVPEKVRFRYRLNGFDKNWINARARRTAFYTNVPAGNYVFEVEAANNEGIWSPKTASVAVEILPFFYETHTFYLLLFVAAILIVVSFIQLRTRHLKNREKELEYSIMERTKQISAQKQEIEKNLQEKELLLKEIHHRVKNNLQIITSLLNLQSVHVKDEAALNAIKSSRGRVKSMGTVHEILYQNNDLKDINIAEFIPRLVKHIKHLYQNQSQKVNLRFNILPITIDLKTAIPLGLIINEIISNSFKHAFKNKDSGIIQITATRDQESLLLTISDNGSSIKNPGYDRNKKADSLGMQLVDDMIKQMRASGHLLNKKGTEHRLIIPLTG